MRAKMGRKNLIRPAKLLTMSAAKQFLNIAGAHRAIGESGKRCACRLR